MTPIKQKQQHEQAAEVTQTYVTDWDEVAQNAHRPRSMSMRGFDEEFVDIADYILRITYWIWHEKKVDLCLKYYSPRSVLHTMTGDIIGNQVVVDNTWATLKSFPDRTLDGENIVWSTEDSSTDTYYTSHLIVSRMTNLGETEWGPPSGKRARIRTIADCICRNNQIVEEWLMRDNALLVTANGFDVKEIAKRQAVTDVEQGNLSVLDFLAKERQRVAESAPLPRLDESNTLGDDSPTIAPDPSLMPKTDPTGFAMLLFGTLWEAGQYDQVSAFYDFRVSAHLTAGRELYGTLELREYMQDFMKGMSDISVSIDHVTKNRYLSDDSFDIAVRWTLTAKHTETSELWGTANGTPLYILASSHWRIVRGHKIREEWTVFDELAIHKQIAAGRL